MINTAFFSGEVTYAVDYVFPTFSEASNGQRYQSGATRLREYTITRLSDGYEMTAKFSEDAMIARPGNWLTLLLGQHENEWILLGAKNYANAQMFFNERELSRWFPLNKVLLTGSIALFTIVGLASLRYGLNIPSMMGCEALVIAPSTILAHRLSAPYRAERDALKRLLRDADVDS